MNAQPRGIPLRPVVPDRPPARTYFERACFAAAFHKIDPYERGSPEQIAKVRWDDNVTEIVLRGVTAPADRTTPAWAAALAVSAVGDFIGSLAALSAGARVLDAAPRLSLDGINSISLPARSGAIDPTDVPWVAEGAPIPVAQFVLTSVTLGPAHKLAIITTLTRETADHGSGETVLTLLLRENTAAALDSALFSTLPATADRPAGIRNGVAALTAATGGGDAAMSADLSALAAAIGGVTTGLAFVAHPAQAHAIRLRRSSAFPADIPVWPTLGVAAGVVIALDPACIVSGFDAEPEISASREAVLHMEDTSPLPIGSTGTPNTVAAPTRSLFQTDTIALRSILKAAWAVRVPGSVAWISGATW